MWSLSADEIQRFKKFYPWIVRGGNAMAWGLNKRNVSKSKRSLIAYSYTRELHAHAQMHNFPSPPPPPPHTSKV